MPHNFLTRILRHLFILPGAVRRHFPVASMQRIEHAIGQSELNHTGQICFVLEPHLHILDILRQKTAKQRAIEVFSTLGIWDTQQNNGVLIYLLLADHDFEMLADRGIHTQLGDVTWKAICQEMEKMFIQGQFEAGVLYGITEITKHLTKCFPATGQIQNELLNAPIVL